jgi:hypothetical protein
MTPETMVDTSSHFAMNTFHAMTCILWCATRSEALADGATLVAPSATHSLMKPTNKRKCFCFWPNCEELHLEAIKKLPSNHPWCQPILQVQCGNTGIISDIECNFHQEVCTYADKAFRRNKELGLWYESTEVTTNASIVQGNTRLLSG